MSRGVDRLSGAVEQLLDRALAQLTSQLAAGYAAWPPHLIGARIFFVVDIDGTEQVRTLQLEAKRPRLFAGMSPPHDAETPFLLFRLTLAELYGLLRSEEAASKLTAEGNEPALLVAIDACLSAARRDV